MHIVDNWNKLFKKRNRSKSVIMIDSRGNKRKYTLNSFVDDYGVIFSLYDGNIPELKYGTGSIEKKGENLWEFSVTINFVEYYNNGYGTFLMKKLIKWAKKNKIKCIYGFLSYKDKEKGNWNYSLPFYENLPNRIKTINKHYFLPNQNLLREVCLGKTIGFSDESFADSDKIKSLYSGYIVFTLS